MGNEIAMVMFVVLLAIAGYICGIVAVIQNVWERRRISELEQQVVHILKALAEHRPRREAEAPIRPTPVAAPVSTEPVSEPRKTEAPTRVEPPRVAPVPSPPTPRLQPIMPFGSSEPARMPWASYELKFGTHWIIWIGALMFLGGVAFALKYSYDNALIGPIGRLAIGVLGGVAAIGTGEWFRRKSWRIPFEAFTGGGFAIFYICVYFAFQVYAVAGQQLSMSVAVLVTLLAVVVAVAHNAISIALLAVLGGYASPLLLSTGENHPYILFTYIALLNLVALGSAWFRRWRALDLVCFLGTAFIYQGWYVKFYAHPSQLAPALIYTSIFYLMFLAAPTLYNLVRRMPEGVDGLTLIVLNALFSVYCYYNLLFAHYRYALGFVVLGQAVMAFLLFRTWVVRVNTASKTAESLLIIALALVTLAIPIEMRLYGIPMSWAVEGALFIYLGERFRKATVRLGGCTALALAAGGLLHRLPLHTQIFTPVVNRSFGAWVVVIVMMSIGAYLLYRVKDEESPWKNLLSGAIALASVALTCALLSMEVWLVWRIPHEQYWATHGSSALTLLWTAIPALCCAAIWWKNQDKFAPVAWAVFAVALMVFLSGLANYNLDSLLLMANTVFMTRLLFIIGLWWGARKLNELKAAPMNAALEIIGHALFAVLVALELMRWSRHAEVLSNGMALGILSAVWAVQGCVLIGYGLVTRCRYRRYTGFVLFGLAAGKTILIDTFQLEPVYRIVSWLGCGALLVIAALLYQHFAPRLLAENHTENDQ